MIGKLAINRVTCPGTRARPRPGSWISWLATVTFRAAPSAFPGCGTGHDVRTWAAAGFPTAGLDIAPSAIRLAREKTSAAGLRAEFHLLDFLTAEPIALFDWLFEHTLFCAIQPQQRDQYLNAVLRWLKPGGQYLAVNYFIPDQDGPPFGTTRDEIWSRFSPHFLLREEWGPRSYPNRVGLERMFWWQRK
jgi:cyclopropane fatty-acyl-phospholipid synthase-like methyltransferase